MFHLTKPRKRSMFWVVLILSIVTFLIAAKSHGRQLRLERELAGHHHVTFGGTNPPFVATLWQKDRVEYWRTFAVILILFASYALAAMRFNLPLPFANDDAAEQVGSLLIFGFLWTFILTFMIVGMMSLTRLREAMSQEVIADSDWETRAIVGSAMWWSGVISLSVIIGTVAFHKWT